MFSLFKRNSEEVIHVKNIDALLDQGIELIDVREPYEYANTSIKGAKNIPMGELLGSPDKYIKKDRAYYLICQSGGRSGRTVAALKRLGFNVINVQGGMGAYNGKKRR